MNATTKTKNSTLPDATPDRPAVEPTATGDTTEEQQDAAATQRTFALRLSDTAVMGLAGGGLLALSAAFLWHDMNLSPAHLVTVCAGAGLGASLVLSRRHIAGLGLLGLLVATVVGGIWYALDKTALLIPAMMVILLGAVLNVALAYPRARRVGQHMRIRQIFFVSTLATLVGTSACYFHFLTLGMEGLGRRLVLTLLWALLGVGLVIQGGRSKEVAMRYSGYALLVAATLKALLHDTTHLSGSLRVSVLGFSGVLLLAGSLLSQRRPQHT